MRRKAFVMAGVGASIAAVAPALVRAQERFPAHAISSLVPFPPGGVADIVARSLAPAMERRLGRPVLVVNKPGAGGALGTGMVAAARPDGYTLLVALASISTNPKQERLNKRPAPFQLNQLAPVARISMEEMMLAVRADSKYRSVGDVVEDARRRSGRIACTAGQRRRCFAHHPVRRCSPPEVRQGASACCVECPEMGRLSRCSDHSERGLRPKTHSSRQRSTSRGPRRRIWMRRNSSVTGRQTQAA